MERKEEKDQDPASARGQKEKGYAAWEDDQQDTAFWGKGKGKGKKGKKGMKGKDSFQRNAFMEGQRQGRWKKQRR